MEAEKKRHRLHQQGQQIDQPPGPLLPPGPLRAVLAVENSSLYHLFHILLFHGLGRVLAAAQQQLRHRHAQRFRQRQQHGRVRDAGPRLPFADGLIGNAEPLRQLLLGPALFLAQPGHKRAELLFINGLHTPHLRKIVPPYGPFGNRTAVESPVFRSLLPASGPVAGKFSSNRRKPAQTH